MTPTQADLDNLTAAITSLESHPADALAGHAEHLNGLRGRLAVLQEAAQEAATATFAGLVSLVDPPDPAKLAAKAAAAGISMDRIDSALWLALDRSEEAEKRTRAAELDARKARAREARTGTKLGEARKAIAEQTGRFMAPVDAFGPRFAGEDDETYVARIQGDLRSLRVWRGWAAKWTTGGDVDARLALDGRLNAAPAAPAGLAWLRDQAADIDGDLPVAELDEAQLRGVVGVELLRLRRELEVARAESEANNARIGEVVAERADLRRELAARATSTGPAFVTVDALSAAFDQRADGEPDPEPEVLARLDMFTRALEADKLDVIAGVTRDAATALRQTLAVAARFKRLARQGSNLPDPSLEADRWGLNDREYFLFRFGQHGAKGADIAGAGVHRLAHLLDLAEANRRAPDHGPSIEAQRGALAAVNPPPRSPFTPEQERAIGSLVGRVTVQPRGQPSRWEAFVDGVLDVPEVVFAASEQSAKNLACVVIARKRWPDLWPETA